LIGGGCLGFLAAQLLAGGFFLAFLELNAFGFQFGRHVMEPTYVGPALGPVLAALIVAYFSSRILISLAARLLGRMAIGPYCVLFLATSALATSVIGDEYVHAGWMLFGPWLSAALGALAGYLTLRRPAGSPAVPDAR
jgi:hypothetical protein